MLFYHMNLFIMLQRPVISKSIISSSFATPFRVYHWNPIDHRSLRFYSSHRRAHRQTHKDKPKTLPPLDASQLEHSVSQLPPRFTPEDLCKTLNVQSHPLVCLHLFNFASNQPRFKHNMSTFFITIKKLGSAQLFEEFDIVVNQALAVPIPSSEPLFNTIIYYYTESRKLSRAINIFKHMKKSKDSLSRPSIKTYNLLFTAMLSRGSNSYINHIYMETIRCLFRQMVNDGIEPDIFSLNSMIKGYVLSLHLNDALRIFHQMGIVYKCLPNEHSYSHLIHGLCAQGRSKNAMQLYGEMVKKEFVPSEKAYNSLVNCLAIAGEVNEAVRLLWEMFEKRKLGDFITYQTVLDALGREGRVNDALDLLREFKEKDIEFMNMTYLDGDNWRFIESDSRFGTSCSLCIVWPLMLSGPPFEKHLIEHWRRKQVRKILESSGKRHSMQHFLVEEMLAKSRSYSGRVYVPKDFRIFSIQVPPKRSRAEYFCKEYARPLQVQNYLTESSRRAVMFFWEQL
ncbi:hypothetical protein H6P81_007656 [Aristolochia fimbriata]|uniref:Pentatricopeptide repeat-containing protein n=1 Tax=Aristolochia fimbriata TaxID=158543 RepID=A0AAV7F475_ARIFI|nr:hypothetical protein H6P81_007656 [Aristolochia fimbriata]